VFVKKIYKSLEGCGVSLAGNLKQIVVTGSLDPQRLLGLRTRREQ
jgi:hypothetical protein